MCGLVGVINTTSVSRVDFDNYFKQALICDSVRGRHSTGALIVNSSFDETLVKKLGEPFELLDSSEFVTALNKPLRIMMGHNRYATKGAIKEETAHPFRHGKITLCHNGTLHAHRNLSSRTDFDVDSEAICFMLSESTNIVESLEKLNGAFALTWFNSETKTFHIARNKERELYIARVTDKSGEGAYIYASELGMLYWLAFRNKISIDKPELVPVGKILTFHINGKGEVPTETPFTPKVVQEWDYYQYGSYYDTKKSKHHHTTPTTTNSHALTPDQKRLSHLVNRTKEVYFWSYAPYKNSDFGECIGYWDDDIDAVLSAIHRDDYRKYLSNGPFRVKVTGVNPRGELFVILDPEKNNIVNLVNEKNKSLTTVVDIEKRIQEIENSTDMSKNQKKSVNDTCKNCDCELSESNKFESWNKDLYCQECHEMFPESIY